MSKRTQALERLENISKNSKRSFKSPTVKIANEIEADGRLIFGHFRLLRNGMEVEGEPTLEEYRQAGLFITWTERGSPWWLADWLRYGDRRQDWSEKLQQAQELTGYALETVKAIKETGEKIQRKHRRPDLTFAHHRVVESFTPKEQVELLDDAATNKWTVQDLRKHANHKRRRKVIEGQAVLVGQYRVILADCPFLYGNKQPSGSGAQTHYAGMTIEALCKLPIEAHAAKNAVLFFWVTAPMLYEEPGPREVIKAWGFQPKTGMVWHKYQHNFGHYVSIRHEHVVIATRGSCLPDNPTPMPDSVFTSTKRDLAHSEKPEELRTIIDKLYTEGPKLELFARRTAEGWDSFGDDAALWTEAV